MNSVVRRPCYGKIWNRRPVQLVAPFASLCRVRSQVDITGRSGGSSLFPLFLDLTEARRETGPPPYLRVWMTAPSIPPPPVIWMSGSTTALGRQSFAGQTVLRPWNEWTNNKKKSMYIKSYQFVSVNQTWKDRGCPRPCLTTLITVKKINSNLCIVSIVPTLCKSATHVNDN